MIFLPLNLEYPDIRVLFVYLPLVQQLEIKFSSLFLQFIEYIQLGTITFVALPDAVIVIRFLNDA